MLQINKKELRERLIVRRKEIPAESRREFSEMIFRSVFSLDRYKSCETVLVYASIDAEVETYGFINESLLRGKRVAVPRVFGREMSFGFISSAHDTVPGAFGIPTFPDGNEIVSFFGSCICITPCLSVDPAGVRLGYGGGYYDRFLSAHKDVYSVAVCFDELISGKLPFDENDVKVDMYVTQTTVKEVT